MSFEEALKESRVPDKVDYLSELPGNIGAIGIRDALIELKYVSIADRVEKVKQLGDEYLVFHDNMISLYQVLLETLIYFYF
jgi:hypothetical protein